MEEDAIGAMPAINEPTDALNIIVSISCSIFVLY